MRLFLLRHAKSDWGDPSLDDHDRPLNARGKEVAPRIGMLMATENYLPGLVLCSTARRARATLDLVFPFLKPEPEERIVRALYLAEPGTLLEEIRRAPPVSLMLVGHNPGIGDLAASLCALPEDVDEGKRQERMKDKYATGGFAVFDFDITSWAEARNGTARLVDYVRPKDLNAQGGRKA